ncbi:hypothetical protein K443DRAFT_680385 [Laccaria amethystina LaAM-08-1]|uniref:Uncharacterized protein n=1 Tax=Laccaria amethystina LaAM-08-1 TaxID=1095629 RepID=A0A0C9X165_9AGAR|nr:hypothetical protein K443DRAFT_680385 [Laccaria amethystina LaAM-08-1]
MEGVRGRQTPVMRVACLNFEYNMLDVSEYLVACDVMQYRFRLADQEATRWGSCDQAAVRS